MVMLAPGASCILSRPIVKWRGAAVAFEMVILPESCDRTDCIESGRIATDAPITRKSLFIGMAPRCCFTLSGDGYSRAGFNSAICL